MDKQIIITLIAILGAFFSMFFLLYVNYKLHERLKELEGPQKNEENMAKLELEIQRRNEGIKNIMEYDINVAYGRGLDNE